MVYKSCLQPAPNILSMTAGLSLSTSERISFNQSCRPTTSPHWNNPSHNAAVWNSPPPPRYNHLGTALRTKLDATSLITLMRKCIPGQLNDADVCVYQKIVKWFDFFHNHKLDTRRLIKLFASSQAFLDHSEINGMPFGLKSRDFLINGRDLLWKVQKLLWMVEIYYDRLMLRLYYERLRFS